MWHAFTFDPGPAPDIPKSTGTRPPFCAWPYNSRPSPELPLRTPDLTPRPAGASSPGARCRRFDTPPGGALSGASSHAEDAGSRPHRSANSAHRLRLASRHVRRPGGGAAYRYAAIGLAPVRASSPSPVASLFLFLARMRVRARRSASAHWGEGAGDRVAVGVRFCFGEVAGCVGGHVRGWRLRRGVRRPTGATAGSAMNGCRRRLR